MPYLYTSDAYSPSEIARRVERVGTLKAKARVLKTTMLGILAGGFIGLGALFYTFIAADSSLSPAIAAIVGGIFFGSGYIIAILAGAEVFTSNNLLAMALAARRITFAQLLRNWGIVLIANFMGAMGLIILFLLSGLMQTMEGAVGEAAYRMGAAKAEITFIETFARAILGNQFVCIAVWISLGGRSVTDKVVGMLFPLTALGALSLEHVVASLYYLPRSLLIGWLYPEYVCSDLPILSISGVSIHLVAVVLGNVIGGSLMVAAFYHIIYRRHPEDPDDDRPPEEQEE
jgi:formate/nitrite transporter